MRKTLLVVALVLVGGSAQADKPYDHDSFVRGGQDKIAPNARRDSFTPADDVKGSMRGIYTGVERAKGAPQLRPDPRRDTFTPVDEVTGEMRGMPANGPVKAKKADRIMPNARRDAFTPADEVTGVKRGIGAGTTTAKKTDKIMPNARRDSSLPVDELTGVARGLGVPAAGPGRPSDSSLRLHTRGEGGVDPNACLLKMAGCY